MARYAGPVCRLCRREGMKLFLKGERCYAEKCAIEKRNVPPGQQGRRRRPNKRPPLRAALRIIGLRRSGFALWMPTGMAPPLTKCL